MAPGTVVVVVGAVVVDAVVVVVVTHLGWSGRFLHTPNPVPG